MGRMMRVLMVTAALYAVSAAVTVEQPEQASLAALVELVATPPAAAQNGGGGGEVECGGCVEEPYYDMTLGIWVDAHRFPNGGDGCAGGGGDQCSRCGGESDCHVTPDPEPAYCHIECGPGGGEEFAAALHDLEEAMARADAEGIVRIVRTVRWMEFAPGEDAVRIAPACGTEGVPVTRPVPATVASRVAVLLAVAE